MSQYIRVQNLIDDKISLKTQCIGWQQKWMTQNNGDKRYWMSTNYRRHNIIRTQNSIKHKIV